MSSDKNRPVDLEKWANQIEINRHQSERIDRFVQVNATLMKRLVVLEDWRDREIERQTRAETKVDPHRSSQYARGFSDGILAALAAIFRNRA